MTGKLMIQRLSQVLKAQGRFAVAVSGGVDSMTLAYLAHRLLPDSVSMYHAHSPAVPSDAAERVRRYARLEGWSLKVIDAGELGNDNYVSNPVNRCYYCKSQLYRSISKHTSATIVSGTNLDDLSDYRPGLEAAKENLVIHPYVEAQINKEGVRSIAQSFELDELAVLPASPCLSSRIETGIPIKRHDLEFIDRIEREVRSFLPSALDVRCRLRPQFIEIEVGGSLTKEVVEAEQALLLEHLFGTFLELKGTAVKVVPYRRGSAFIHVE